MTDDEGWESRMAARRREWLAQQPRDDGKWKFWEQWRRDKAVEVARIRATLTLFEAVTWLRYPFVCACPGKPNCCVDVHPAAMRLRLQAQRLALDLAALRGRMAMVEAMKRKVSPTA